jgi:hypothetical protein
MTDQRREIVRALIGDRHERLFNQSAEFHAEVEALARLLPVWIEGLAARAEIEMGRRSELVEQLMRSWTAPPEIVKALGLNYGG